MSIFRGKDNEVTLHAYLTTRTDPSLSSVPDVRFWLINGVKLKQYSASQTWEQCRPRELPKDWSEAVWFNGCVPKHAFNMWIAQLDRMPTRSRLSRWGVTKFLKLSGLFIWRGNSGSHPAQLWPQCWNLEKSLDKIKIFTWLFHRMEWVVILDKRTGCNYAPNVEEDCHSSDPIPSLAPEKQHCPQPYSVSSWYGIQDNRSRSEKHNSRKTRQEEVYFSLVNLASLSTYRV